MNDYTDLRSKAVDAHEKIKHAKDMMFLTQVLYKKLRLMLETNENINKEELSSILEDISILHVGLKNCIDQCNLVYSEITDDLELQELCGFDGEKVKEDSEKFKSVTGAFITDLEEIISKGKQLLEAID